MSLSGPSPEQRGFTIARVACCVAVAILLGGCVSSPGSNLAAAPKGEVATGDPLVLNTAPAPGSKPGPAPVSTTDDAGPIPAATGPVVVKTETKVEPAGSPVPAVAATAALPTPPTPAAPETINSGFPNINTPQSEPEGALLSPEERAKMIAALEALRKRQHGTAATDLTPAKKLPAKCKDATVAASDPDCAPPPAD
jgi:hypothetical protein